MIECFAWKGLSKAKKGSSFPVFHDDLVLHVNYSGAVNKVRFKWRAQQRSCWLLIAKNVDLQNRQKIKMQQMGMTFKIV